MSFMINLENTLSFDRLIAVRMLPAGNIFFASFQYLKVRLDGNVWFVGGGKGEVGKAKLLEMGE